MQAAIERARARKQAGSGSERLKRLKIEASMARVALKKAEKQLLSHDTPEQHGLVAELRAAAEAADKALADAEASLPRDLPSAPPAALDDEAELKKAWPGRHGPRPAQALGKAFGEAPGAEQRATLDELRAEVERCEATLARLERHAPKPAAPGDDGQAALKRAKIALVGKRAALKKAEQAGVMDSELERLRGELQAAERDLHAAEDACGKPAPELVRIDKRPVDPRTRELKTELAYARAALKKLERLANADAAALAAARARLSAAERALTEHGTGDHGPAPPHLAPRPRLQPYPGDHAPGARRLRPRPADADLAVRPGTLLNLAWASLVALACEAAMLALRKRPPGCSSGRQRAGHRPVAGSRPAALRPLVADPGGDLLRPGIRQAPVRRPRTEPVQPGDARLRRGAGLVSWK